MKLGPVSISWKRWLTEQPKRHISRATGIPLTRSGRNAKLGRMIIRALSDWSEETFAASYWRRQQDDPEAMHARGHDTPVADCARCTAYFERHGLPANWRET
jgi:hypothetical protein